ncbi:hypothetical protein CFP66_39390 [Pseudonocardia sp. MH-G8]|nr:hypothetical protein CFP66_39390 [Pseudonocardia sp. MH-G8]
MARWTRRYSRGLAPYAALKALENVPASMSPHRAPTSPTGTRASERSRSRRQRVSRCSRIQPATDVERAANSRCSRRSETCWERATAAGVSCGSARCVAMNSVARENRVSGAVSVAISSAQWAPT